LALKDQIEQFPDAWCSIALTVNEKVLGKEAAAKLKYILIGHCSRKP